MSKKDVQVNFRMPETLKAELEAASKANNRSLTAEIVDRLEFSLSGVPQLEQITTDAMLSLERSLEDTKRQLKQSEYTLSQMRLMRYLLDQVAINEGDLPFDLLNVIKILTHHSNPTKDSFDLQKAIELINEAAKKTENLDK